MNWSQYDLFNGVLDRGKVAQSERYKVEWLLPKTGGFNIVIEEDAANMNRMLEPAMAPQRSSSRAKRFVCFLQVEPAVLALNRNDWSMRYPPYGRQPKYV